MINAQCPDCSARFFVADELVAGKKMRFRCRKCGGTITVDGSAVEDDTGVEKEVEGSGDMLLSQLPPAPTQTQPKVRVIEPKKRSDTLRPSSGSAVPDAVSLPKETTEKAKAPMKGESKAKVGKERATPADAPARQTSESMSKKTDKAKSHPSEKTKSKSKEDRTSESTSPLPDEKKGREDKAFSKPRSRRDSKVLESVFDTSFIEEDVEIPMDIDDFPEQGEDLEIEPEPLSVDGVLGVLKPPPPPVLKARPPKPRKVDLNRPSSGRIDIAATMSARKDSFDAPLDLFAPVVIPPTDSEVKVSLDGKERQPSERVVIARAATDVASSVATSEKVGGSKKPIVIGLGVAALLCLAGVGLFVLPSKEGQNASVPAAITTETQNAKMEPPAPEEIMEPGPLEKEAEPEREPKALIKPEPTTVGGPLPKEPEPIAMPASEKKETAASKPMAGESPPAASPTALAAEPTKTSGAAVAAKPTATTGTTPAPTATGGGSFDKSAAAASINALKGAAQGCKQPDGPQGHARVSITFAPSGRVTIATTSGPPFAGTPVGSCLAATFRRATVPPFSGPNVTVHTSVPIF